MTEDYNKLFNNIMDDNFNEAKTIFKKKMAEKAIDRIEQEKKEIAQTLFKK